MDLTELSAAQITSAKRAFTTRRVPEGHMKCLIAGDIRPRTGDLVMARVDEIGSHKRIELPSGRKSMLAPGDIIIVVYGNRYAPDQFEAIIGEDLGPCELAAAGGIASRKLCMHDRMHEPTKLTPLGLIGNAMGAPLNLDQYAIAFSSKPPQITTIFVAGTAMNAGKTMTSACLVRGFTRAGFKVAGIKSTGTGSGGDLWFMADMGANSVLDFTDAGLASTYLAAPETIERNVIGLITHAGELGNDIAIVEVADGLQHEETATLLKSPRLRHLSKGIIFAANDALGAQAGVQMLGEWGWRVLALSGQLTRSPLAMREATGATGMPVVTAQEIQDGLLCAPILGLADSRAAAAPRPILVAPGAGTGAKVKPTLVDRLKGLELNSDMADPHRVANGGGTPHRSALASNG
ncbi:MAG: hypothetical protein NW217_15975 [Hyphomicrobiaceae bacterium]|nr:hypothetical protein [Hyphomicrobiaceae bacterium]